MLAAWLWLAAVPLLWAVSFLYDAAFRPHDMNLPGLLAVASVYYLVPWWPILFLCGWLLRRLR